MDLILERLRKQKQEKRDEELFARIEGRSFEELFEAFCHSSSLKAEPEMLKKMFTIA